jgi:hypothetical protein
VPIRAVTAGTRNTEMTKAARTMPTVTAALIWVRKGHPGQQQRPERAGQDHPGRDDRRTGVLDGQVGGDPGIVAVDRLLAQAAGLP